MNIELYNTNGLFTDMKDKIRNIPLISKLIIVFSLISYLLGFFFEIY